MGNYKARRPGFLQAWQINAAELMFQGKKDGDIAKLLWPKEIAECVGEEARKKKIDVLKNKLQRLRKDPHFMEYYKTIITEWSVHNVGKSMMKLSEQVDEKQDKWLANKAANDVLQRGLPVIMGNEANTITVEFRGAPELGSPTKEDAEG